MSVTYSSMVRSSLCPYRCPFCGRFFSFVYNDCCLDCFYFFIVLPVKNRRSFPYGSSPNLNRH